MPKRCFAFKRTDNSFWIPDEVWKEISPFIPKRKRGFHCKRKREVSNRVVLGAVLCAIFFEIPWESLSAYGDGCSPSLAYKRYVEWKKMGVFQKISNSKISYDERIHGGVVNWIWLQEITRILGNRKDKDVDLDCIVETAPDSGSYTSPTSLHDFLDSVPDLARLREITTELNKIPEFREYFAADLNEWVLRQIPKHLSKINRA